MDSAKEQIEKYLSIVKEEVKINLKRETLKYPYDAYGKGYRDGQVKALTWVLGKIKKETEFKAEKGIEIKDAGDDYC